MGLFDSVVGALGQGGGAGGAITDLLQNQEGGLGGLVGAFEKAGLGEAAKSWVGKGDNLPISAEQIRAVLGSGPVAAFASKLGVDPDQAAGQIADLLPQVIDRLTPDGHAPSGGLGDLLGKLKF